MQAITIAAIYFVTWFICLFLVLPFGVRNQVDAGEIVPGTEPGSPVAPRFLRTVLVTSVLAAVLTGVLFWLLQSEWLQRYWS